MAKKKAAQRNDWTIRKAPPRTSAGRRVAASDTLADIPDQFLQSDAVSVADVFAADPPEAAARRAGPPELVHEVRLEPGAAALLAVRHPSGALTFHASTELAQPAARRGARETGAAAVARFRVPVRRVADESGRRGLLSKAVKVVVLKIAKGAVDKAVSVAFPLLAAQWEKRAWAKKELQEGWFQVSRNTGGTPGLRLTAAVPTPGDRALLMLHGTFSHAVDAFSGLGASDFFDRVRPLYGDRIYAYNHFSVSRTPSENVRQLLERLPQGDYTFDAITHSRGGLVLRNLVEQAQPLGSVAARFRLGHAVLVASPNDGTPLATPQRWQDTVAWFANLIEVFPDNPFTTGAEFVSEAIVWLASHLAGDLPGLRSMDAAGELVEGLQSPPGPPANAYSALVSNFHPDEKLWQRALDVGVDSFFAGANDLVVPSEGGWRVERDGAAHIPTNRIGCFGPGGNLDSGGGSSVHHVNFFARAETTDFLAKALSSQPLGLAAIDPDAPLPDRRFARRARIPGVRFESQPSAPSPVAAPPSPAELLQRQDDVDTLHIVIMDSAEAGAAPASPDKARVFATYGGARVTSVLPLRAAQGDERTRFGKIIRVHERIKNYTNRVQGSLPRDDQMIAFGVDLFETLFQGEVRRLYDEARSRQRSRKLDLVLTSMIPWIAEKPWEFAYDTGRRSFLATEDVHFVRNVLTSVPADVIPASQGPLRILVASAQPVGFGQLSIDQEVAVIRRGFDPLIEARLVVVDTLARATPAAIHGMLATGHYDIVHFIGHGVFDEEKQEGCLIFEDARGGEFPLGARSAREIFCGRGLSLVFLNACQTGSGGRADFNKGVAQALVSQGLPALVANQYSVLDASATSFAQYFYWSLAQGLSIGEAAREARIAVNYSLHGEPIDWAVPVVYARDSNKALCRRPDRVVSAPTSSVRRASRRATSGRPLRIAVWDVDGVFPALDRTLGAMNAAQEIFGFELVELSAPLDAWYLDERAPDGTPYLWADRLAQRLQNRTVELRVNLLACVTRHWMCDDDTLNIYAWWPDSKTPAVVIYSTAGFGVLQAEGPETDRAIANTMVSALAGYFGGVGTHPRAPKNCPLASDEERDPKVLVGAQEFDATCRKQLQKKLPTEFPALEALLRLFRA